LIAVKTRQDVKLAMLGSGHFREVKLNRQEDMMMSISILLAISLGAMYRMSTRQKYTYFIDY